MNISVLVAQLDSHRLGLADTDPKMDTVLYSLMWTSLEGSELSNPLPVEAIQTRWKWPQTEGHSIRQQMQ